MTFSRSQKEFDISHIQSLVILKNIFHNKHETNNK